MSGGFPPPGGDPRDLMMKPGLLKQEARFFHGPSGKALLPGNGGVKEPPMDHFVTGLQVQYGNPGNFSFISLRKRARCLTRCLLRVISSNGEGGEGGQSISAVRSFGAKTPVGVR